ncbi:sirohydrochlorin cobaltochelatase [Clostridium sp. MD294]|uniref:sirohydrochlorin cobaltochelatase n=1 Tax=Clostridium sp. MD294 TaxID=97138 RepID=UPI0002CC584F|nr:sirohydrochlorin cobaltochelatase [Clostridium sp. MD294]NDO45671.1 sirohydrochlorin cobaltochelatase [Clostridium sp. MD294]USF30675.1 Sirohydrochlorin cobaltochelatase [Clostridium sp. MD294]
MKIDKKAILVISFGTSYIHTMEKTIKVIEEAVAHTYTDYKVYRAFTSQFIINKLQEKENIKINTIKEALEEIIKEGYTTVICQPTHIMPGIEYEKMINMIKPYEKSINNIIYGTPLLSSSKDYDKVVKAIIKENSYLQEKDILILVGHGTEHFADASYAALDYRFTANGYNNILVGTVEGYPNVETILEKLKTRYIHTIYITPFMIVAGDHANNDICGDGENTWKTKILSQGYSVKTILKGLGEYEEIRNIFIEHIKSAIENKF